jgi:hypothetical protein
MAAKKHRGHRPGVTVPVAVLLGFAPLAVGSWQRRNQPQEVLRFLTVATTGYDYVGHRWTGEFLGQGIGAIGIGMGLHWAANKFGVNRMLARAKVPILRI